jgi:hypothetical protein
MKKAEFEAAIKEEQKNFPLFTITVTNTTARKIAVLVGKGTYQHCTIPIPDHIRKSLEADHILRYCHLALAQHYPHIYVASTIKTERPIKDLIKIGDHIVDIRGIWVRRNGNDAEAIKCLSMPKLTGIDLLQWAEAEAIKATQQDWFFCSGHGKAEPATEGHFYHFAARYCFDYGVEHPEALKEAREENYN